MASAALERRLARLSDDKGRIFLMALDHCASLGVVPGLEDIGGILDWTQRTTLTGVVINAGSSRFLPRSFTKGSVVQLMTMPTFADRRYRKRATASVALAVREAADAVSVQLSFDDDDLGGAMEDVGRIIDEAHRWSLPVLAMVNGSAPSGTFDVADKVRIAIEIGADIVKCGLPPGATPDLQAKLRQVAKGATPLLLAGGATGDPVADKVTAAVEMGFRGICIGRHIFQSPNPAAMINQLRIAFDATGEVVA